jgi:hypothetical protein
MLPVSDLTGYFPEEAVKWLESSEVELSRETLPEGTRIYVLKPTLVGQKSAG